MSCSRWSRPRQSFSMFISVICPVLLAVGCSAASSSSVNSGNCKKRPAVSGAGSGTGGNTSLVGDEVEVMALTNISTGLFGDSGIGTGYIDIFTKTDSGVEDKRRCTMQVRPIESSTEFARIWTAGHCSFDPQSDKFRNSKYVLQIYYKGGYFTAEATFEGFAELSKVSEVASKLASVTGQESTLLARTSSALPSSTGADCLAAEKNFIPGLASRKQVACFSRGEMRGLKAKLTLTSANSAYFNEVMGVLREREKKAMAKLDTNTKNLLKLYEQAHHSERRRVADLRSLAYSLSKKLCDTASDPSKSAELVDPRTGVPDSTPFCASVPVYGTIREAVIGHLGVLPAVDRQLMESIYNDTTSSLTDLRSRSSGCNLSDSEISAPSKSIEQLTPCDMNAISEALWTKYVDKGLQNVESGALSDSSLFGYNPDTYFVVSTNAAQTTAQKASSTRGKARTLVLNAKTVLDFGLLTSGKDDVDTMLTNIDPAAQSFYLTKGDSGSMLSIFGYFPMGLLSTVDGEKTSGGASITPLPQVGTEEESPTNVNAGC